MIDREAEAQAMAGRIKDRMARLMADKPATRANLIDAAIAAAADERPPRVLRIERTDDNRLDVLIEFPSDFAAMNGLTAADLASDATYEINYSGGYVAKVKP